MALLQRFIPSRKTVEVLCFLVLTFAHTGYFFGDECPTESSLLCGVPPLDCRQRQQIQDAIADGTVDRINNTLAADGPIFVGNSSFPPIVTLTEEQMCAIERCFGGFAPILPDDGLVRRKREVGSANLACIGNVGAVQYTVDEDGRCAQVVVNNMPSRTGCKPRGDGCIRTPNDGNNQNDGCCCEQSFRVKSYAILLCESVGNIDFHPGDFTVNHCTCCKP